MADDDSFSANDTGLTCTTLLERYLGRLGRLGPITPEAYIEEERRSPPGGGFQEPTPEDLADLRFFAASSDLLGPVPVTTASGDGGSRSGANGETSEEDTELPHELKGIDRLLKDAGGDYRRQEFPSRGEVPGYELLAPLGKGGQGIVHKAVNLATKEVVAIKQPLLLGDGNDWAVRRRFRRAAEACKDLRHPNVVPLLDRDVESPNPFAVYEYVDGRNLGALIRTCKGIGRRPDQLGLREAGLRQREIARAFEGAAQGLHAAHKEGVTHRDLKPANLIFDGERLRILDFGLAYQEGNETITGSGGAGGITCYMSPQAIESRAAWREPSADIYALGVVLYHTLTHKLPFEGKGAALRRDILSRAPIYPSAHDSKLHPDLENIVLKCLQKNPSARYATALALAQDLERFVQGLPVEATDPPRIQKPLLLLRRNFNNLCIAALLVIISLLGGATLRTNLRERELLLQHELEGHLARGVLDLAALELFQPRLEVSSREAEWLELDPPPDGPHTFPFDGAYTFVLRARSVFPRQAVSLEPVRSLLAAEAREHLQGARERFPARPEPARLLDRLHRLTGTSTARDAPRVFSSPGPSDGAPPEMTPDATGQTVRELEGEAAALVRALEPTSLDVSRSDARTRLARLRALHPASMGLQLLSAWAHLSARAPGAAEQDLELLLASATPPDNKARIQPASVVLGAASLLASQGEHDRAGRWLDRFPDDAECRLQKARLLLSLGLLSQARGAVDGKVGTEERRLLSYIQLISNPSRPGNKLQTLTEPGASPTREELSEIGEAYLEANERLVSTRESVVIRSSLLEEAVAAFTSALTRDPTFPPALAGLATAHFLGGDTKAAHELSQRSLELAPDQAVLWDLHGILLDLDGNLLEAQEAYQRAVTISPRLAAAHYNLAWSCQRQQRYLEARDHYQAALALGVEQRFEIFNQIGLCEKRLRNPEASLEAFRTGAVHAPASARILHNLGTTYDWEGQGARAISVYQAVAHHLDPLWVDAWCDLGEAQRKAGDAVSARLSLEKALELDPSIPWASNNLSRLFLATDDFPSTPEAAVPLVRAFEQALLDPRGTQEVRQALEALRIRVPDRLISFATIDAHLRPWEVVLAAGSRWRHTWSPAGAPPPRGWNEPEFEDAAWHEDPTLFLLGQSDLPVGTQLEPPERSDFALLLRRTIQIDAQESIQRARLSLRVRDGCSVFLNGRQIDQIRVSLEQSDFATETPAQDSVWEEPEIPPDALREGKNLLAIKVVRASGYQGLLFDARLEIQRKATPAARLGELEKLAANSTEDPALISYLQGKLLEEGGDPGRALELYAAAALGKESREGSTLDRFGPEALLAATRVAQQLGRPDRAEKLLATGLAGGYRKSGAVWNGWIDLALRSTSAGQDLLARFPEAAPGLPAREAGPASDVRWLLEHLAARQTLRINCGGEEVIDGNGARWGRDRFYVDGYSWYLSSYVDARSSGKVPRESPVSVILETQRGFYDSGRILPGYRIPLPHGRYGVSLHFTATDIGLSSPRPSFRVVLENVVQETEVALDRLPSHTPVSIGPLEIEVNDGALDIGFAYDRNAPVVCGIEVEPREILLPSVSPGPPRIPVSRVPLASPGASPTSITPPRETGTAASQSDR